MPKKPAPKASPASNDPRALTVSQQPEELPDAALARTALRPSVQAALTLMEFNKMFGEVSLNGLVDNLVAQCDSVSKGDLSRPEALLVAQAHTLDAIFQNLARRASSNMGQYLDAAETYLRLALKAQSQCRATLEALAAIKSPPVVYARQANIAAGPQQINNNPAGAQESETEPTKLLEMQSAERLDTRAPSQAVPTHQDMATMGAVDRAANRTG